MFGGEFVEKKILKNLYQYFNFIIREKDIKNILKFSKVFLLIYFMSYLKLKELKKYIKREL